MKSFFLLFVGFFFFSLSIISAATDKPLFCKKIVVQIGSDFEDVIQNWLPGAERRHDRSDSSLRQNDGEFVRKQFAKLFEATLEHPEYAWYPISFLSGGLEHAIKPADLEGRVVVGFQDWFAVDYSNIKKKFGLFPDDTAATHSFFYSGKIQKVEYLGVGSNFWQRFRDYLIHVEDSDRAVRKYNCSDGVEGLSCKNWTFVLGPRMSVEEIMTRVLNESHLKELLTRVLKRPVVSKDFDVIQAIFELYNDFPATYKKTAIVKTLRGQKIRIQHPKYFGFLKDDKNYSLSDLNDLAELVNTFLENTAGMTDSSMPHAKEHENRAPYWITARNKDQLKIVLPTIIQFLQEQKKT
ncbi:MAG: hypothetical protein JWQ35_549 [Bacteriovoracaceae bacterium]|nr:hypothetical protein [Bacteriovoracaceae bacterium]